MSRQTELIARRIAAGVCRDCGQGAPTNGRRCGVCAEAAAERQRRRRGTIEPGRRGRKAVSSEQ